MLSELVKTFHFSLRYLRQVGPDKEETKEIVKHKSKVGVKKDGA